MTTDLQQLWRINRNWRQWMDANTSFVTPDTLDCLRYALCESTEALDAWLRQKNQHHARNNGREHTIEQELADTAMLLLTAYPGEEAKHDAFEVDVISLDTLDDLCYSLCAAIMSYSEDINDWWLNVSDSLHFIATYPDINLPVELRKCHHRLAMKHGQAAYVIGLQLNCEVEPWIKFNAEAVAHD